MPPLFLNIYEIGKNSNLVLFAGREQIQNPNNSFPSKMRMVTACANVLHIKSKKVYHVIDILVHHQSCTNNSYYGYGKFSLRLIGSAMFSATFNLVTSVGVP